MLDGRNKHGFLPYGVPAEHFGITKASEGMQKKLERRRLVTRRPGTFPHFGCEVGGGDVVCGVVSGAIRKEVDEGVT